MAAQEASRTQAWTGLSLMTFSSLCFHAIWKIVYSSEDKASFLSVPDIHDSAIPETQYQALMSKLDALSTSIAAVNTSLHAKIANEIPSMANSGGILSKKPQQDEYIMSPAEKGAVFSFIPILLWVLGLVIFCDGASKMSKGNWSKTVLFGFVAANLGLAVGVFGLGQVRGYVYVLLMLWPMQLVWGWTLINDGSKVEVVEKGEKR